MPGLPFYDSLINIIEQCIILISFFSATGSSMLRSIPTARTSFGFPLHALTPATSPAESTSVWRNASVGSRRTRSAPAAHEARKGLAS